MWQFMDDTSSPMSVWTPCFHSVGIGWTLHLQVGGWLERAWYREVEGPLDSCWLGLPGIVSNAAAPANVIEGIAQPHARGLTLIKEASERLHLSARGFHLILKLARTIADLDGAAEVGRTHLAEALTYRIDTTRQLRAA
jgi:Magnesium chelatase, subunit ChlI C-terminal